MPVMGVDLRATPKRSSSVVVLSGDGRLAFRGGFRDNGELLEIANVHNPRLIAVGVPLNLPAGLCCLEVSCPCDFASPQMKGRQLELELSRMAIGCFFTNKSTIIRSVIYRAIELNGRLSGDGHAVIEVYPHATKVMLFGDKVPSRSSANGLPFLREHLVALIGGLDASPSVLDQPTCNATLNAYTALLHCRNGTDTLGDPAEGVVVIPKLPR